MGCTNIPNDRDELMLEESAEGKNCEPDAKILEECKPLLEETRQELNEMVNAAAKVIPPSYDIFDHEIRALPMDPPTEIRNMDSSAVTRGLCEFHPKDILLVKERSGLYKEMVFKSDEKDRPANLPEIRETSVISKKIAPTVENLVRMLNGDAPRDESNKPIELHHHQQKATGPLFPMGRQLHREKEGIGKFLHEKGKRLEPQDRKYFKTYQRPAYYEWKARTYLGEYWTQALLRVTISDEKVVKN